MPKREERGRSMDCSEVAELLPVYLNRSLEEDMARQVAAHLATCAACRREERDTRTVWALHEGHLPVEVLLDYALAQPMPAPGRAVVESHLAVCERCSEEVATVRQDHGVSSQRASGAAVSGQRAFGAAVSGQRVSGLRTLAWAACLAAVVTSAGWIWTWRHVPTARTNLAVVELLPAAQPRLRQGSTDPAATNRVELSDDVDELVLVLLSGDSWCESGCLLEIHEVGQAQPKRRVEGLVSDPNGHVTLALPANWLSPGRSVLAVRDQISGELVAEYLVELQPSTNDA